MSEGDKLPSKKIDPNRAITEKGGRGRDRVISGSIGAGTGAAIGTAIAPGIGTAIGAGIGGLTGLIFGDTNTVLPLDVIAIPAFEAHLISGNPSFMMYIRAGETIVASTSDEVLDLANAQRRAEMLEPVMAKERKPRKPSLWDKWLKNPKRKIFYKTGKKKGRLNMKAMGIEYRKHYGIKKK